MVFGVEGFGGAEAAGLFIDTVFAEDGGCGFGTGVSEGEFAFGIGFFVILGTFAERAEDGEFVFDSAEALSDENGFGPVDGFEPSAECEDSSGDGEDDLVYGEGGADAEAHGEDDERAECSESRRELFGDEYGEEAAIAFGEWAGLWREECEEGRGGDGHDDCADDAECELVGFSFGRDGGEEGEEGGNEYPDADAEHEVSLVCKERPEGAAPVLGLNVLG